MRKEQLFEAVVIGSLAFTAGCEAFSPKRTTPTEDLARPQTSTFKLETPEITSSPAFTPTLSPTPTPAIEEGFLTGALICPVESQEFELPKMGEVVDFQGMDWKVVGVDEFDSDRCENGIQIVLQLCPCEEETPTATATYLKSSPTPTKEKETPFPPTPTSSPRPPTEMPTPTPEPTDTPVVPTATIPPTITPQPPEPTPTASS